MDRISPLLDVARRFILIDTSQGGRPGRKEVRIEGLDLISRAKRIRDFRPQVLICGAISRPLEVMLVSAGIRLIPNTCGPVEDVLNAFASGRFKEQAFLMPGCSGRRQRLRGRDPEDGR